MEKSTAVCVCLHSVTETSIWPFSYLNLDSLPLLRNDEREKKERGAANYVRSMLITGFQVNKKKN